MTTRIYKCAVMGTYNSQMYRNIYILRWNDPAGINSPNTAIMTYLNSLYTSGLRAHLSNLLVLTQYERWYRQGTNWIEDGTYSLTASGASASDALPGTMAGVVLGKSSGYRGFGRKFLSGILEADQTNGSIQSTLISLFTTFVAAYIATVWEGACALDPGTYNLKTETFHPFASGVVDILLGTQRRRKPMVGD